MTLVLGCALVAGLAGEHVTIEAALRDPARRPTVLQLTFANRTMEVAPLTGVAHVQLEGSAGAFWGPFDLDRFETVGPNARPATLAVDARGTKRLTLDLRSLRWGRSSSSSWPDSPFGETVPQGHYSVKVIVERPGTVPVESNVLDAAFTIAMGALPGR